MVVNCDFGNPDLTCPRCGFDVGRVHGKATWVRNCPGANCLAGDELHRILARCGLNPRSSCRSCESSRAEMDSRGCAWCRENVDTIVGWLHAEYDRRRQQHASRPAADVADSNQPSSGRLPWLLRRRFRPWLVRMLVRWAIWRAEKERNRSIREAAQVPSQ